MHTKVETQIALWNVNGVPARLIWEGQRWRVVDMPTPLHDELEWLPPMITHAPARQSGWRFIARAEDSGDTRTFDVLRSEVGWVLSDVWD